MLRGLSIHSAPLALAGALWPPFWDLPPWPGGGHGSDTGGNSGQAGASSGGGGAETGGGGASSGAAGSAGAPVFETANRVVGIHHRGFALADGKCDLVNNGVAMQAILGSARDGAAAMLKRALSQ